MNYRQLYQRVRNLDHLYLQWDRFADEAHKEQDPEASRGLRRIARRYRKRYDELVADRRKVTA